ncbi:hypothetical protein Isop_3474 [Isosphaera pallida ATCC 43644]|uniref:Uncharacterized protein n=1 Tax=Isosphaera pallida (strain ATCC 43644 / DSM 9630 / IS1B) TaxID=575540 RepID=E8QWZ2_ISOPI|nr:hypothetical protein Isop_3474 [Isosphaera pallida ATCC 43644]
MAIIAGWVRRRVSTNQLIEGMVKQRARFQRDAMERMTLFTFTTRFGTLGPTSGGVEPSRDG